MNQKAVLAWVMATDRADEPPDTGCPRRQPQGSEGSGSGSEIVAMPTTYDVMSDAMEEAAEGGEDDVLAGAGKQTQQQQQQQPDVVVTPDAATQAPNREDVVSLTDVTPARRQVVSFVLENMSTDDVDKKVQKQLKGRHSRTVGLSYCYAIVIVLLGFVFPMAEALQGSLVTESLAGGFRSYLYSVSAVFFVCETILHSVDTQKRKKKLRKMYSSAYNASTVQSQSPPREGATNEVFDDTDIERPGGSVANMQTLAVPHDNWPNPADGVAKPRHTHHSQVGHGLSHGDDQGPLPSASTRANANANASANAMRSTESALEDEVYDQVLLKSGSATFSHEGTSIYVRIGCTLFAIANLVYVALRIEKTRRDRLYPECAEGVDTIEFPHYFHLVFIVFQTFFLLKNDRLLVVRYKPLLRFGLMHAMATNMCVWLRFLILEVVEGLHDTEEESGDHSVTRAANETANFTCTESAFATVAPYLFPFILEYSLIALGTLAVMFSTINVRLTQEWVKSATKALYKRYRGRRTGGSASSAASSTGSHSDSHSVASREEYPGAAQHRKDSAMAKVHTGLFLGLIILAGIIVSMVLFFYWDNSGFDFESVTSYAICELILEACLLSGVVAGLVQFSGFFFDETINNSIDHALLLISGTGFLLLKMFVLVASFFLLSTSPERASICLTIAGNFTAFFQCLLQMSFILDGMQRRAADKKDIANKKGRAIVTFLIVVNISAWVFSSFEEKRVNFQPYAEFYGDVAWSIIFNAALPLELFFRFHSSACFADMWQNPYTPEHED